MSNPERREQYSVIGSQNNNLPIAMIPLSYYRYRLGACRFGSLIIIENENEYEECVRICQDFNRIIDDYRFNINCWLELPLHEALIKNKIKLFNYLLTLDGVPIDAATLELHMPVIFVLNHSKHYHVFNRSDVYFIESLQTSMLHYAVKINDLDLAQALIEKGAEIDGRDYSGRTPLQLACLDKIHTDLVYMLLYYGADVTVSDNEGVSPFLTILRHQHTTELQEIFFDYVFDQDRVPVDLNILIEGMKIGPTMFHKLLEKTSSVIYEEADLRHLSESLRAINSDLFKIFIQQFEDVAEALFSTCDCLSRYVEDILSNRNSTSETLAYFYAFFDSPYVSLIVENYKPAEHHSIVALFASKHTIKLNTLTELTCRMLSHGIDLTTHDLNAVYYERFGYCELFKIMLHMDIVNCPVLKCQTRFQRYILPTLIYDITADIDKCLLEVDTLLDDYGKYYFQPSAFELCKFFARSKLKKYCLNWYSDRIHNVPSVPSLQELARNSARQHIIKKFNVKNSRHLYTIIKRLPICEVHKAILSYEKELYRV